jgi:hypothetical protein
LTEMIHNIAQLENMKYENICDMYIANICDMYSTYICTMYEMFFNFDFWLRIYMRGFRSTIHILSIGRRVKMCKVDRNDP